MKTVAGLLMIANAALFHLWLIHDMDIVDKHRELDLVVFAIGTSIRPSAASASRA